MALAWALTLSCGGSDGTGPSAIRVVALEVNGAGNAMGIGQTMQLSAVARDSSGAPIAAARISWSSSPASVASVSASGLVRAVSVGSATVTASSGEKTATWDVAVRDTASLPRALRGRVERVHAVLTGTYTVTDDFVLLADSTIRINGTLKVAPGANLTLWSDGLLELSGTIERDTTARSSRLTINGQAALPDEHEQSIYIGLGAQATVLRNEKVSVGCPIAIAGSRNSLAPPRLEIYSSILIAEPGSHGTKAQPNGGEGCAVEIGTNDAQMQVTSFTGEPTQAISSLLMTGSILEGGQGGTGYSLKTADGTVANNIWSGIAGSGGKGGDVGVEAATVEIRGSELRPGSGGGGGFITVDLKNGANFQGDGESLFASSGGAGASGDLALFATSVIAAEKLVEAFVEGPGGFIVSGGNGRSGGDGGDLVMIVGQHSARGQIFNPANVPVQPSPPDPARYNVAIIDNSANGGVGTSPLINGGKGGDIHFETAANISPHLKQIILDNVSNGGVGFDGCALTPPKNGSDGGWAGAIRRKQTPMTHTGSFNGGNGGPGLVFSGRGGQSGVDVDANNLPLGKMGFTPMPCPNYFGLSTTPPSFQHVIGTSPCPDPVASPTLTNYSTLRLNFNAVFTFGKLTWGNANGTLEPGGSTTLPVTYPCNSTESFNETGKIVGTPEGGGPSQTITVPITGQIAYLAVQLIHPLGAYPVGAIIPLSRVTNGRVNAAHPPFCQYLHLHATTPAGIVISDGAGGVSGPHADPEVVGCGYGAIITVVSPVPAQRRP